MKKTWLPKWCNEHKCPLLFRETKRPFTETMSTEYYSENKINRQSCWQSTVLYHFGLPSDTVMQEERGVTLKLGWCDRQLREADSISFMCQIKGLFVTAREGKACLERAQASPSLLQLLCQTACKWRENVCVLVGNICTQAVNYEKEKKKKDSSVHINTCLPSWGLSYCNHR